MAKYWTVLVRHLQAWRQQVEFTLARRFGLATAGDRAFLVLIPLVGVVAGFLGVAIHRLIDTFRGLIWNGGGGFVEAAARVPWWWVIGATATGGLLVAILTWLGRLPLSGGGMSVLIEAIALRQGHVDPRPILLRAFGAVATVGSGGSLGREGPMIRLGAMIASWLGSRLGLSTHRLKVLVGCGAAAGLAAAYNIPVGATLFVMEVILGNFALEIFGPIVISSVVSTLIARGFEGNVALYASPGFELGHPGELLAYAGLGVVGALASIAFVLVVKMGAKTFDGLPFLPAPLKPLLGMTALGALAVFFPQVLGGGVDTITQTLQGAFPLKLLLILAVAKLGATALTAGAGGAGGLFTPSLCCGALVGGAYGQAMQGLFPALSSSHGAFAIAGMAALAAGTSHAPISIILILFELTGEYELILPLMLTSIVSGLLSRKLYPYSMYTEALSRRGIELSSRMEETVLAGLKAVDLLRRDPDILRPADGYGTVVERFLSTHRQRLFVVTRDDRLVGSVSLHDIKHVLADPESLVVVVAHDLMRPVDQVIDPEDRLDQAAAAFARSSYERLPVVERDTGHYAGHLAKRDVLAIYAQEVLGRPALLATFTSAAKSPPSRDYVELPPDFAVRQLPLPAALVGQTLGELKLPQKLGARVIQIRRPGSAGEELLIPDGSTVLQTGDRLIFLGPTAALDALESDDPE